MNIAIIVSGGKGLRISSSIPKQFINVNGKEMICYTIEKFQNHPLIDEIVVVTLQDYISFMKTLVFKHGFNKVRHIICGGETRQESVRNALNKTKYADNDFVLIHDGDRPLVSDKIITECIKSLEQFGTAVVATDGSEIDGISNAGRKAVYNNVLYNIQTPQCFKYLDIKNVHNRLKDEEFSDDASLFDKLDKKVNIIIGDSSNYKITTDEDLKYFEESVQK